MRFFLPLCSLLFSLSLHSEEVDTSLAITENIPSAIVAGAVNAITGDHYFVEEDIVIQGAVPLKIPRYYVSSRASESFGGWGFFKHLYASYAGETKEVTVVEPNGTCLYLEGEKESEDPYCFKLLRTSEGYTNAAHGMISGKTNIKNIKLEMDSKKKGFFFTSGDGTLRYYQEIEHASKRGTIPDEMIQSGQKIYCLQWEKLPNRTAICYAYDEKNRLSAIRTTNFDLTKAYAGASFHYHSENFKKKRDFDIHTSDGKKLSYRYMRKKKRFFLSEVSTPACPHEKITYPEFRYGYHRHKKRFFAQKRGVGLGRYYSSEYYTTGNNDVGEKNITVEIDDDKRLFRVKTLSAPVGEDKTPYITHKFFYYPEERYTEVQDVHGIVTEYYYSEEHRLEKIVYYNENRAIKSQEQFVWETKGEGAGNLLSYTRFEGVSHPVFSREFSYDRHGNILEEKISGCLTGDSHQEHFVTQREYSQDAYNLLVKERVGEKVTLHHYLPQSSLPSAQFVCEREKIKIRHFYEYNKDFILIREITDDGRAEDKNDLKGVTTRLIKEISLTESREYSHQDRPHIIREKYWDGEKEVLLKKIILTYNPEGLVSQKDIYDSEENYCYSCKIKYDNAGRIIESTNALGQVEKNGYDEVGNHILTEHFSGLLTSSKMYDFSNRLTRLEERGKDGIVHVTEHQYDKKNNQVATLDHFGNKTTFVYDFSGNLLESHLPPTLNEKEELYTPILTKTYDSQGRVRSETNAKGECTVIVYNAYHKPIHISHPDGSCEEWRYYLDGTLKMHINQVGTTTSYKYDFLKRPLSKKVSSGGLILTQETYTYSTFHLMSKKDADGICTTFTYDGAGRKIAEYRLDRKTTYRYDSLGREAVFQEGEYVCVKEFDFLDREVARFEKDTSGRLFTKKLYEYDAAGNCCSTFSFIEGKEAEEKVIYDSFNRPIAQIDPLGFTTTHIYDEDVANVQGQKVFQVTTTDPLGLKTMERFDPLGRVVLAEKKKRDRLLSSIQKFYDPAGNVAQENQMIFYPDGTSRTMGIQREFGPFNRLLILREEEKITHFSYTSQGFLEKIFKPDKTILTHTYDPLGRLISLSSSDQSIFYTYQYNLLGDLIQSTDENRQLSTYRTYDEAGNLIQETLANGFSLTSEYDERGRRVSLTLPDCSLVKYSYDACHLRQVTRMNAQQEILYTHTYDAFDLAGNVITQHPICGGGPLSFSFDLLGRRYKTHSPFFSQEITHYDPVGNVCAMEFDQEPHRYTYDDLYQLTSEEGHFSHTYAYDTNYNRHQKDQEIYVVNGLNELVSAFSYDANGNPLVSKEGDLYTYDALDRLIGVQTSDHTLHFTYDSFHRRMTKQTIDKDGNQESLFFLYDVQNEIGAAEETGRLVQLRVLASKPKAEIGCGIAFELKGRVFAPIYDLFGNVVKLIPLEAQEPLVEYRYSAFGEEEILHSEDFFSHYNPWRFCSKRIDQETGLFYFGRRFYAPALGRWLTPDPAGFTDILNLYTYVLNNAYTHLDLHGLVHTDWYSFTPMGSLVQSSSAFSSFCAANEFTRSHPFQVGSVDLLRGGIGFTNGINTREDESMAAGNRLSHYAQGVKIYGTYNASNTLPVDILESVAGYLEVRTPPVQLLKDKWNRFIDTHPSGAKFLEVCYSGGGGKVKHALKDSSESVRQSIIVLAFAPSDIIPSSLCFKSYNYISSRDFVTHLDIVGKLKYGNELHTLDAHPDAAFWDHDLFSPTFEDVLRYHLNDYIKNYGDMK